MFVANSVFVFLFLFWIEGAGEIGTVRGLDEMGDRGGSAERATRAHGGEASAEKRQRQIAPSPSSVLMNPSPPSSNRRE